MFKTVFRIMAIPFFTALGIEIGGPLIGAVPSLLFSGRPMRTALELAGDLKFWAIAMAMGGSFTVLEALESGLMRHQLHTVVKHGAAIVGAFAGAQIGYWIVDGLVRKP